MPFNFAKILVVILLSFTFFTSTAQTRKRHFKQKEIGFFGGASYYIGDLNQRSHFKFSQPAFGALFRYSTNYRFAFKFAFNYGNINATDKSSNEPDQIERNLNFKSRLYEFSAVSEFNFVEYRLGHEKHYRCMYIFGGIGTTYINPKSNIGEGYEELQNKKTEGANYSKIQLCLPFGVGFKWNVTERVGLNVEWGPRKLFTDYLDDVSSSYPMIGGTAQTNQSLNGGGTPGTMRGNPRSKDWYFFYGIGLNIRLNNKIICNQMN